MKDDTYYIMKRIVDIKTWARREEYLFFKEFQSPLVGVTTEVDCAKAYKNAKAAEIPVSLWYWHAAMAAVNQIEEFRYREEDGQVVLYDRIDLFAPISTAEGSYRSVRIPFCEDFSEFVRVALPIVGQARSGEGQAHGSGENCRDVILISVNPWYHFTSIQLSDPAKPHEAFPIFTFGKFRTDGDKMMMPVALRVNHGFIDGFHIGCFLQKFQELLDR